MIKRTITYAALALLTLGFTGCQQEDDFAPQVGEEQELRIATRSTSDEGTTVTFTDDFTLELSSTADNAKYETHQMTYTDGAGWNAVKSSILPAHAFAYKGQGVSGISYSNKWNYTVELQEDQSSFEKLADADVMIATGSANAESPLNLNFQHYYAKVTFNVELASEFNPVIDEITDFYVVTSDGDYVEPYIEGNSYIAVIPADSYAGEGVDFVILYMNGIIKKVAVPDEYAFPNGSFTAGTHYTFDLKVGKDKVTLTPVSTSTDFPGNWYDNDNYDDDVNLNN